MDAPFRRNRYFTGKLLGVEDFSAEQSYFLGKRRLHNRLLHGSGIVAGLDVELDGEVIRIEPGVAIDCAGREIVVPDPKETPLPPDLLGPYICLGYLEREVAPVPTLQAFDSTEHGETQEMGLIEETFEVSFSPRSSYEGHEARQCRWQACGGEHPITLALLDPARKPRRARPIRSGGLLFRIARSLAGRCS